MWGWLKRFRDEFRAECARIRAEREPREFVVGTPSSPQLVQAGVDMVVWRARGCGYDGRTPREAAGHIEFDDTCSACWDGTHCAEHEEFTQGCLSCQAMKDPHVLGTVSHYHADPEKQADESELGQGREVWRT